MRRSRVRKGFRASARAGSSPGRWRPGAGRACASPAACAGRDGSPRCGGERRRDCDLRAIPDRLLSLARLDRYGSRAPAESEDAAMICARLMKTMQSALERVGAGEADRDADGAPRRRPAGAGIANPAFWTRNPLIKNKTAKKNLWKSLPNPKAADLERFGADLEKPAPARPAGARQSAARPDAGMRSSPAGAWSSAICGTSGRGTHAASPISAAGPHSYVPLPRLRLNLVARTFSTPRARFACVVPRDRSIARRCCSW